MGTPASDKPSVVCGHCRVGYGRRPASGNGTVVLDVDSGIVVPSFMGKSLRSAVEVAQQSGLEISVIGSGIARQQSPAPGSHLLAGQRVTVRFSH